MDETQRIEMARIIWNNRHNPIFVDSVMELEADLKKDGVYDRYDKYHGHYIPSHCLFDFNTLMADVVRVIDSNRGLVIGDIMKGC